MDLKVIWAVLVRRWYLVLLVVAFAVGATFLVAVKVGPTYQAQGATLVFPPVATVQRGAETVTQGNPFLALEGVSQARDIVIRELTSKSTADDFALKFPGSTFEATPDVLNNAPIIAVTVEAPSEADAITGIEDLSDRIPGILQNLQADLNLDANSLITSRLLTQDSRAEAVHKDQIRAAVVAAVVALGLGLLAVALVDGLLTGRKKKRQSPQQPASRSAPQEVHATATPRSPVADPKRNGVEPQPDRVQVAKTSGSANRLRPRMPTTTMPAGSTNGSNGSKRGEVSDGRRANHGSHSVTDPAARR